MHASTVASDERASVSVVFLESSMPLDSSDMPSATGAPSVVVDSICKCCSVDRYRLVRHQGLAFGRRSFVTVELENPSLLVVHLVESE